MSKSGGGSKTRISKPSADGLGPFVTPWLISLAVMPVALVSHAAWGQDPTMVAVLAVVATVLTGATYATWNKRHEHTRMAATVFAGGALGWVVFATANDPWGHTMRNAWAIGGIFVSLLWNIRHGSLSAHQENDKPSNDKDGLFEKVQSLSGSRTKKIKEQTGRVEAKIQMKPGEGTVGAVQADKANIASAVGMGEDEVTVSGVPGRADQVKLTFQLTETLKKAVRWPGCSAPGRSIADAPLSPGMRSGGEPLAMWLVGSSDPDNPRPLPHTLCTGVTGAGKTETIVTTIIDMRSRIDVVPIVADPEKFKQGFGAIEHALGLAVDGEAEVHQFIRNLPDAIKYRAHLLGGLMRKDGTVGYQQWEPECWTLHGIPLLFIDIEEAATVLSGNDEFDQAIRTARSVGISLCASMTTAHHSNIERKTRGQFTNSLTHGCVEQYDARFALSSGTLEKGADPTKWRNNYPGSLYAELVGSNPEIWADEARSFYLSREQKQAELKASQEAGYWATCDTGTMQYLTRGLTAPEAAAPGTDEGEEQEAAVQDWSAVGNEDGEAVDITMAIPAPKYDGVFPLRPEPDPETRLTTEQARALLESKIDELEAGGQLEVTFADLNDLPGLTGRSRAWVYEELKRLTRDGRLSQVDGKPPFRIKARILNGSH
jgi:hypothetical protein